MDLYVHRLVADAFCEHPDGCNVVNHIDFNMQNNRFDNLEWVTQRSNVLHSMKNGRVHRFPNARPVVGIKDGIKHFYRSANEAAIAIGTDASSISKCCRKRYKSSKGYKWEYAEVSL